MNRTTAWALTGAAVVLGTVGASPARAADPVGRIDHVESSDGQVRVLFSVPDLPADVQPDPATVQVSVNGQPFPAEAAKVSGADVRRTTVLALDVSLSMRVGQRFEAALAAARAYLEHAPADIYIGLVTFANVVTTVQAPTQDRAQLVNDLSSLELRAATRLYDGVLEAMQVAGETGQKTVLLLSDGKDTSETPLNDVLTVAKQSDIRIDAVALDQQISAKSPLAQMADVSGGTVTRATPAELEKQFADQADELAKQLLVTFTLPGDTSVLEGTLRVSVDASGAAYFDDAFVRFDNPEATTSPSSESPAASGKPLVDVSKPVLVGAVAMLFLGMAYLLGFSLTRIMPVPETATQRQLSLYTVQGMRRAQPRGQVADGPGLRDTAAQLVDKLIVRRDFEEILGRKLDAADVKMRPSEWLLAHVGFAVVAALLGLLLSGGLLMVIFLLLGLALPWLYLSRKEGRRVKKFNAALAPTLQILAGGLSAGLSLPQAVDTVVQEGTEPIASEFRRALVEARLGIEIEDTLETIADRMKSLDFAWVVMAVRIQREVGGNLSELLLNVAATLREREYLRRQVQVLSAEGRLSGWILGGLPPLFFIYLALARPTYLAPLLHTHLGWIMLGFGIVLMTIGAFWMSKVVKVEV